MMREKEKSKQKKQRRILTQVAQFGGSPVKVGEDEYTLFRDSE